MPPTSGESGQGSSTQPLTTDMESLDSTGGATVEKDVTEMSATTTSAPVRKSRNEPTKNTIVLKTHDGDGYVLPHLPWEVSTSTQLGVTVLMLV